MVMVSGPNSSLKHISSLKRLSGRRQTILRPSLVLIFQGEVDGDGFGSKFLEISILLEKALYSKPENF